MPQYVADCLVDILKADKKSAKGYRRPKVLIVGVTYKKDVKDRRKSPPLKLIEILQQRKYLVDYYDPIIPYLNVGSIDLLSIKLTPSAISKYDCVLIATDHTKINYKLILKHARLIYDIRNVYDHRKHKKVKKI